VCVYGFDVSVIVWRHIALELSGLVNERSVLIFGGKHRSFDFDLFGSHNVDYI